MDELERSMRALYEHTREWYWENWPKTRNLWSRLDQWVVEGRLDNPADTGEGWFAYPDGEPVHIVTLLPCLDGWTPETLQGAEHLSNEAWDWTDSLQYEETGERGSNSPLQRSASAQLTARLKQVRSAKAGAENLAQHNNAKAGAVADRLAVMRVYGEKGDTAAMIRWRIKSKTGIVLDVSDRQIRRDLKKIHPDRN